MVVNKNGQALVEYILLIFVVVGFVFYLFNHSPLGIFFSDIGRQFKQQTEFSYRHALFMSGSTGSRNVPANIPYGERSMLNHPSYVGGGGGTRFFGPAEIYPKR